MKLEEKVLKEELIGRTISDVIFQNFLTSPICIIFEDGYQLYIDASGDDMAHTEISLTTDNGIEIINL